MPPSSLIRPRVKIYVGEQPFSSPASSARKSRLRRQDTRTKPQTSEPTNPEIACVHPQGEIRMKVLTDVDREACKSHCILHCFRSSASGLLAIQFNQ